MIVVSLVTIVPLTEKVHRFTSIPLHRGSTTWLLNSFVKLAARGLWLSLECIPTSWLIDLRALFACPRLESLAKLLLNLSFGHADRLKLVLIVLILAMSPESRTLQTRFLTMIRTARVKSWRPSLRVVIHLMGALTPSTARLFQSSRRLGLHIVIGTICLRIEPLKVLSEVVGCLHATTQCGCSIRALVWRVTSDAGPLLLVLIGCHKPRLAMPCGLNRDLTLSALWRTCDTSRLVDLVCWAIRTCIGHRLVSSYPK